MQSDDGIFTDILFIFLDVSEIARTHTVMLIHLLLLQWLH